MSTRKDQIIDKAIEIEQKMHDNEMCVNWGLIQMAEWADDNPILLYYLISERFKEFQTTLETAFNTLMIHKKVIVKIDENGFMIAGVSEADTIKLVRDGGSTPC
jgi:hypothetical protein